MSNGVGVTQPQADPFGMLLDSVRRRAAGRLLPAEREGLRTSTLPRTEFIGRFIEELEEEEGTAFDPFATTQFKLTQVSKDFEDLLKEAAGGDSRTLTQLGSLTNAITGAQGLREQVESNKRREAAALLDRVAAITPTFDRPKLSESDVFAGALAPLGQLAQAFTTKPLAERVLAPRQDPRAQAQEILADLTGGAGGPAGGDAQNRLRQIFEEFQRISQQPELPKGHKEIEAGGRTTIVNAKGQTADPDADPSVPRIPGTAAEKIQAQESALDVGPLVTDDILSDNGRKRLEDALQAMFEKADPTTARPGRGGFGGPIQEIKSRGLARGLATEIIASRAGETREPGERRQLITDKVLRDARQRGLGGDVFPSGFDIVNNPALSDLIRDFEAAGGNPEQIRRISVPEARERPTAALLEELSSLPSVRERGQAFIRPETITGQRGKIADLIRLLQTGALDPGILDTLETPAGRAVPFRFGPPGRQQEIDPELAIDVVRIFQANQAR